MRLFTVVLAAFALLTGPAFAQNLAHPAKHRPTVVLLLHAGGWVYGDATQMDPWIPVIRHRIHAAAVSLNYPVLQAPETSCLCVTSAEHRIERDARWFRHAGFRVLALGWSAGGELADWLAARCDVDAAVSISGPTDLVNWAFWPKPLIGIATRSQQFADSPIDHLRSCTAPMFLAGGSVDPVVPHQQQIELRDRLHHDGLVARYQPYGGGHEAPRWVYDRAIRWLSYYAHS